jgi:hypothetical protein
MEHMLEQKEDIKAHQERTEAIISTIRTNQEGQKPPRKK